MNTAPRIIVVAVAFGLHVVLAGCVGAQALEAPPAAPAAPAAESVPEPSPTPAPAGPREGGGGIVFGDHHAFMIAAPAGWLFDNQSGAADGLHAVAYHVGETYRDASAILYARGQDYAPVDMPTIDAYIATDLAGMRGNSPDVVTFELPSIRLDDGTEVRVVGFRGDRNGNVEAVGYLALPRSIVVLALSARSQARFDAELPAFEAFVRSYKPMERKEPNG